uniref:dynamin family protein n=1 Tax=Herbidospora sakaeratensis TaxID=564415 RepID=UPI000784AFE4|nr:dynamin family protein [Herbidospora sakaeratensis]
MTYESLRDHILALLADLSAISTGTTVTLLDEAAARLRDSRLRVLVCGEFKRGKSSLINALLEEPDLLPVDAYYATRAIVSVAYGEAEVVTAHTGGQVRLITRAELADHAAEGGAARDTTLVEIRTPNRKLASGLVLLDSPGVGGVLPDHTAATLGALNTADAVIFVTDTSQPLMASELDFLRTAMRSARATDDVDALICVCTRFDKGADRQELLANTRAKLADVTGREPVLIPVSSVARQRHLAKGHDDDRRLANFDELERVLWATLARRRIKAVLGDGLRAAADGVQAALGPVDTEIAALDAADQAERDRIRRDLEEARARKDTLRHGRDWRDQLRRDLDDAARRLRATADGWLDEVWERFEQDFLFDASLTGDPERLVGRLTAECTAVTTRVNRVAEKEAARILAEFTTRYGIGLTRGRTGTIAIPSLERLRAGRDRGLTDRPGPIVPIVRGGSFGAAIGASIGSAILPGIGTLVGGFIGACAGAFREVKGRDYQDNRLIRENLRAELKPAHRTAARDLGNGITDAFRDLARAAADDLTTRLTQEVEAASESIASLERATRTTGEQTKARRTELQDRRARLLALDARVRDLSNGVSALAGAPAEPDDSWADE